MSDASKLVKPESEAHTAQCLHRKLWRKPSVIKLLRHLYNSLRILVYLEPGYEAIDQMSVLIVISCHCAYLHSHTYTCMFTGTAVDSLFP